MVNVLKKLTVGNPLINLHLWDDLDTYEAIKSDSELVNWFHSMLDRYSHRPLVCSFINAMINHATGHKVEPEKLLE